jgi:hypothetical protein
MENSDGRWQLEQPQVVAEHTAVMGERVDDVLHAVEVVDGALLLPVQLDGFEQMLALNVEHLKGRIGTCHDQVSTAVAHEATGVDWMGWEWANYI